MARSFPTANAKLLSAFVADKFSVALSSRGFSAASQGSVRVGAGGARSNVMLKKGGEETTAKTSWVPDPVTGYYRPENKAKEIDAAELREMLLKHKARQH